MKAGANDSASLELLIDGASCASCVKKIESALIDVPGVSTAEMNFALRTVSISGSAEEADLIKAVEKAGYSAKGRQGGQ